MIGAMNPVIVCTPSWGGSVRTKATFCAPSSQDTLHGVEGAAAKTRSKRSPSDLDSAYEFLMSVDEEDRPSSGTIEKIRQLLSDATNVRDSKVLVNLQSVSAFCGAVMVRWTNDQRVAVLTIKPEGSGVDTIYRSEKNHQQIATSELISDVTTKKLVDIIEWTSSSSLAHRPRRLHRPARLQKLRLFHRATKTSHANGFPAATNRVYAFSSSVGPASSEQTRS